MCKQITASCSVFLWIAFHATLMRSVNGSPDFFGGTNHVEYLEWFEASGVGYSRSSFLKSIESDSLGVALHWTIEGDNIRLAVAARATGWVGFGISEAGGMKGSDVILFSGATAQLVDSYVLGVNQMPFRDDRQSWQLESSFVGNDFIIFEASRAIDSDDTQDRKLLNDKETFLPPTRVIGAWGVTTSPSFHGSNYTKGAVRFFSDTGTGDLMEDFRLAMETQAEGKIKLAKSDYPVPDYQTTTYVENCFTAEDLAAASSMFNGDPLHLIAIESFIDPRAAPHVHHFLVFGSRNENCDRLSQEVVYGWAPGALPLEYPPEVGLPLGGETGYFSFRIQIHYDNVNRISGILDSSGIFVYYTSQLRDYDLGVLQAGDPLVFAEPNIISGSGGLTQHSFECAGTCTSFFFQENVTVFTEGLHMHENGRMMSTEIIRNNVVIHSAASEFYDFEQQGFLAVQQEPYQIQPGDGFRITCSFDADPGERWGVASSDEMCIAYFSYYPRQTIQFLDIQSQPACGFSVDLILPGCGAEYSIEPNLESFDRVFGSANNLQSPIAALIELIISLLRLLPQLFQ